MQIKDCISYPLYLLFRKSLDEGVVPANWKCANISPIYNKGSKNKVDNYRPVSLTSEICKFFKSFIRDSVVHYLEVNALILDSQHSFCKEQSCLSNLLTFHDTVTSMIDSGNNADNNVGNNLWSLPKHLTKFLMYVWGVNWIVTVTRKL